MFKIKIHYNMALIDLTPQFFFPTQVTQLPVVDFFANAKNMLPQVYQNAPNFMATVEVISHQKQKIYDIIRSLVNVFNLNNKGGGTGSAAPTGIYLEMLASVVSAPYTLGSTPLTILTSIKNTINFVNSRGRASDFYQYFVNNGLSNYFTNFGIEEDGNATIFFNIPAIDNTPLTPPSPQDIFYTNMDKLKAAGIKIILTAANVPFFQLGSLPTDTPPNAVAPGNAGFGGLSSAGRILGGGYFKSL